MTEELIDEAKCWAEYGSAWEKSVSPVPIDTRSFIFYKKGTFFILCTSSGLTNELTRLVSKKSTAKAQCFKEERTEENAIILRVSSV